MQIYCKIFKAFGIAPLGAEHSDHVISDGRH